MGREFKFFIVSSLFVLGAVFAVYTASSEAKGKPKNPPAGGVITYAHHTKTVNNASCSDPAEHVQAAPLNPPYQAIPKTNPMFCWSAFGNTITNWSFTLKNSSGTAVPGCSTGSVGPATISMSCNVTLNANAYYTGYLSHVYNGNTYSDNHVFKTP